MKIEKPVKITFYVIISFILLLGYSHLESRWIKTTKVDIYSDQIPDCFIGKKLVFISDIHHGPFLSIGRVNKLVQRINNLEPDFILLGGDYVHTSPKYIQPVFEAFSNFHAKYGIYAVLGNHEHRQNAKLTREMMVKTGIHNCDNKSFWIRIGNDSIKIGGVGDFVEDIPIIDSTLVGLKEKDFAILLSHNPDYLDYLERIKTDLIDLTLSGHTHGGQVTIFGLRAFYFPSNHGEKYRYGLKKFGKMQSYITSGIGTIALPLRFSCRPEIAVINLKKHSL
jgi:predicted MPP superfamily phosphohydrolase